MSEQTHSPYPDRIEDIEDAYELAHEENRVRDWLNFEVPATDIPQNLAVLHDEVVEDAQDILDQTDPRELNEYCYGSSGRLQLLSLFVKAGQAPAIDEATGIIENLYDHPLSEPRMKKHTYNELATSAYQGGLIEQADEIAATKIGDWHQYNCTGELYKLDHYDRLVAKLRAVEPEDIAGVVEDFVSLGFTDPHDMRWIGLHCIEKGRLELARSLADRITSAYGANKRFDILLGLVAAGDASAICSAREAALLYCWDDNASRVSSLLQLAQAGDKGALYIAKEVAQSEEDTATRFQLLTDLGKVANRIKRS